MWYSLRTLRHNPAFAVTAVLTLGLGIGGNAVMFSVIHAVLLKPLEYRDPDRLVYLSLDNPQRNARDRRFSLLRFEETQARSFTGVGAYLRWTEDVTISGGGEPESLKGARVSANFLDILGAQPLAGRSFLPAEDTPGSAPVALISAGLWKRRFGGDPQVIGKTATINATPHTIVGILPEGFAFPFQGVDVWVTKPSESSWLPSRYWKSVPLLSVFARLKPQVSREQAQAELEVLNRHYVAAYPGRLDTQPGATVRMIPLKDHIVSNTRPMLWMLFGAVGFVLLIACANVASLLLARASSRAREFAVRAALGASRGRLMRQLLAESVLLAAAGGVAGLLLAEWSLTAMLRTSALALPRAGTVRLDGMVLGFTLALSLATGVLFGLFPSLAVSRPDLAGVLRESGRGSSGPRGALNVRGLLVVGQVALSVVLLIGAALLIQSLAHLRNIDPGFQPANLLTMKIALPLARYDTGRKRAAFFEELVQQVGSVPGVRAATMALSLPSTTVLGTNVRVEGQPPVEGRDAPAAQLQSITPGYFHTLEIPLRRGREFTPADNRPGAPPVVVINESFARRFWPEYPRGPDPVGRHMGEGADRLEAAKIVGVAADAHERGQDSDAGPEFYVPCAVHPPQSAYLAVRTTGDPRRFVNAVRRQVLAIDRDQPVSEVRTMEQVLDASVGRRRLALLLLGAFAGVALLLAAIGVYGVIAYSVAQRNQEVGIRRALGAQGADILRLIVRQALLLALAGVAIGAAGALALTRLMRDLLFHVSATDPATFVGIAVLFVAVALAASFFPARRATRIDPMAALRVG